jgi:hypothetical protein
MGFEKVPRWAWIIVAIIIGGGVGYVRQLFPNDDIGNTLARQQDFEAALVNSFKEVGGKEHKTFEHLTVRPIEYLERKKDPKNPKNYIETKKKIHLVTGWYYAGAKPENNMVRPDIYTYRADIPYHPIAQKQKGAAVDPNYTVLNFLDSLKDRGVTYRYAWWEEKEKGIAAWIVGSVVIIGLIWPSVIYLLAFGQWTQPKSEKWNLKGARKTKAEEKKKPAVTDADLEELKRLEAQLEKNLQPSGNKRPAVAAAVATEAPVKKLAGGPAETVAVEEKLEDHHYEARKDDFYPVERKATNKK